MVIILNYKPNWLRIILIAVIFNFALIFSFFSIVNISAQNVDESDLQEISWVEVSTVELSTLPTEKIETFPEIIFTPIEIPKFEMPVTPEPVAVEKTVEPPKETSPPAPENKPSDDSPKLKAVVKVYPKDLIEQLIASGAVKEKISVDEKIILSITIGVDGKVKKSEIKSGVADDDRGKIIKFVSEIAASSWIFEPYLDEDGNPAEMKTQIEFAPEDF